MNYFLLFEKSLTELREYRSTGNHIDFIEYYLKKMEGAKGNLEVIRKGEDEEQFKATHIVTDCKGDDLSVIESRFGMGLALR